MNGFDIALLALTAISALAGLWRGLIREVLGIGAWAAAVWLSIRFLPQLTQLGLHLTSKPQIAAIAGGSAGFVVALAVFSVATSLIARVVKASPLGALDRLLGLVFGLLRAVIGFALCYILASIAAPIKVWPDVVQNAQSLPYIYRAAKAAENWLPDAFHVHLEAPTSMTTPGSTPVSTGSGGANL